LKIALTSLDQCWENKPENKVQCERLCKTAKSHGAECIVFPEMTLTGFSMNVALIAEDVGNSESIEFFSDLAKKNDLGIIAGAVLNDDGKVSNNALMFENDGKEIARYAKIHPFSFAGEHKHFVSGSELKIIKFGEFILGFAICYDLRFPELFSTMANECDVIVVIANWPARRVEHWKSLLKARAIENQIFIMGVNRIGRDGNGLDYVPSSLLFGPDGSEILPLMTENEINVVELNKEHLIAYRQAFPTKQDSRPDLYRKLMDQIYG
jgi:predicted amidohydrolase